MSQYLYEKSLVERLRSVLDDDRVHIIDPDNSIRFLAEVSNDKTHFPAVVISRGPTTLSDYRSQSQILKGQSAKINDDGSVKKLKLIEVRFQWQVDVFAVDRYTCDEILRELVFFYITYPRYEVKVPYGLDDLPQNFDIIVGQDLEDNSDLMEFSNRGEYFRETLTIYTENAHLYSSRDQMTTYVKSEIDSI